MPTRHAILGPSSGYRWLVCTPSARFEEQIQGEESEYAVEGDLAHDLAALVTAFRSGKLQSGKLEYNRLENVIYHKVIAFYTAKGLSQDDARKEFSLMLEHAHSWADLLLGYGGEILIEHEYDISAYVPLSFGTADGSNILPKVLYVSDFKYGAGVRVSAKNNVQMMLYGVGALTKAIELGHKPETVVLTIFQPRAGGKSTWEISVTDLLKWAEMDVRPKALLAIAGEGEFVPGAHCQFCKARTRCAAYFKCFQDVKGIQDKRVMTDRDLAIVLTYGPLLTTWIKKIEEEAIKKIQAKKTIPGFKLVAGRGKRQFRNEDDVVDILLGAGFESEQIFTTALRSLTDFEKELRPKRFAELLGGEVINVTGKPQIAPEDDDRPGIKTSAADEYDDVDDLL